MRRFVSIWLPLWPIERMRRIRPGRVPPGAAWDEVPGRPAVPFALVGPAAHGLRLTAVTPAARALGLSPGQKLADARAAVPALLTAPAEPEADATALAALAVWCGRYGPRRNVDGPDGLWIDVTGVAHLFGGEAAMLADLTRRLAGFGLTAHLGLAGSLAAAWALARHGPGASRLRPWSITPVDDVRAAERMLGELPAAALRLDADTLLLLRRLGLTRVAPIAAIPRSALALRFQGPRAAAPKGRARSPQRIADAAQAAATAVLDALDRLFARTAETPVPLVEPPRHLVRATFAEPLMSTAGIEGALAALGRDLAASLCDTQEGARRVRFGLYRVDGTVAEILVGTSSPSRDDAHLVRLIGEKLDTIDAGFGVDVVTLEALVTEPLAGAQTTLAAAGEGTGDRPGALIDRLSNRLGPHNVLRLVPAASHLPERAQRRVPALEKRAAAVSAPPPLQAARPPILLARAEPVCVLAEVPEGPPVRFTWRRVGRRILRAEGPERIAPEWWRDIGTSRAPSRTRDYYRVEDEHGGRYWLFREGLYSTADSEGEDADVQPRWFIHGIFP